jgi:glycosyltransferase involved in cell wall biosynthesis
VGARVELISPRFHGGRWYGGLAMPLPGDPTQRFLFPWPRLVTRRMARCEPSAVIVPTPGPFGMFGMFLAKRRGARLIVGFHTHFERLTELNGHGGLVAGLAQWYLGGCNRKLFREADLVLANSDEMVQIGREIGAEQVDLMGTSIPRRFLEQPPVALRPQPQRVLFAGRLAPEKNLQAVVEAAEALPDLQFQVAGDGPLRPWIEEQAARLDNLEYSGWVRRSRILPLVDSADILVLPSTVESFGTVALEAMARARIVVVSAQCGILSWEHLERGLFQMAADESLADALARVVALEPDLREQTARYAREAAVQINADNLRHWIAILSGPTAAP